MANLKGYRFFTDTETTGLSALKNQILTLDYTIKDDSNGKVVADAGYKIKLKKNKAISPYALYLTNINPFSKEYESEAIPESEAIERMKKDLQKYTVASTVGGGIVRPKFTAYNARFDQSFIAVGMNRNGLEFGDFFNKSVTDPLKTVRAMIKSKALKTDAKGSAKLTHAAKALGVELGENAHSSKWDNLAQAEVYEKTFKMLTGKSPYDTNAIIHNDLFEGEIYHITTNSKTSGLKKRHILVLKNLDDEQKIIALDLDSIKSLDIAGGLKLAKENSQKKISTGVEEDIVYTKKSRELFDKTLREFNYATIIEENIVNDADADQLIAFAADHSNDIIELKAIREETIRNRFLANGDVIFDSDVYDIDLIQGVEDLVVSGQMSLEKIKETLAQNGLHPKDIAAIITKAHEHSLSKGNDGIDGRDGWDDDAVYLALKDFDTIEKDMLEKGLTEATDGVKGAAHVLLLLREKFPEKLAGRNFPLIESALTQLDNEHELQDDTLAISSETKEETVKVPAASSKDDSEEKGKVIEMQVFINCKVCGRALKGEVSKSSGIGPECRKPKEKKKAIKKPKAA